MADYMAIASKWGGGPYEKDHDSGDVQRHGIDRHRTDGYFLPGWRRLELFPWGEADTLFRDQDGHGHRQALPMSERNDHRD